MHAKLSAGLVIASPSHKSKDVLYPFYLEERSIKGEKGVIVDESFSRIPMAWR
jgi:hypothetical protein